MTRRCRIHCANLRGDGAIVCPSCWSKVPAHLKSEVAAAPRDTMAARIAARKVYEWLNGQANNPETVLCPLTASAVRMMEEST